MTLINTWNLSLLLIMVISGTTIGKIKSYNKQLYISGWQQHKPHRNDKYIKSQFKLEFYSLSLFHGRIFKHRGTIMRKIKIFIGSSIVEFKNERQELENFIHKLSNDFIDKYEIMIIPFTCETADNAMARTRKQDEYNKQIAESEMCFFLFFTRAGEYTIEELNYAFNTFKSSEQGKPKVYVYFKIVSDTKADASIEKLKQILDKNYGHFYSTFESLDTVKLRILLNLKFQEMSFLPVEVYNGQLLLEGEMVPGVDMAKVGEFANNENLQELESRLSDVEEKYYELLPVSRKSDCSDEDYKEFCTVAGKRFSLKEQIEDLQKQIFELSLRLSQDDVKGEMTPRMREAYRLLERGDMEGCLSVLNQDDIDSDFEQWEKKHEDQGRKRASIYIREHMLAIETLMTMYSYTNRNEEIISRFKKVTSAAKKYKTDFRVILDYSDYLFFHQNPQKAMEEIEYLLSLSDVSDEVKGNALDKAALFSLDTQFSEKCLRNALDVWDKLGEKYNYNYISTYSSLAHLLFERDHSTEATEMMEKAVMATAQIVKKNVDPESLLFFGNSLHELANMYAKQNKTDKAEEYFKKEIKVRQITIKSYPETNVFLSIGYEKLADLLCKDVKRLEEAEEFYLKAVDIIKQQTENGPSIEEEELSDLYCKLAYLYERTNRNNLAEEMYNSSIQIIERLHRIDPLMYKDSLLLSYQKIESFYNKTAYNNKAETVLRKIEKLKEL